MIIFCWHDWESYEEERENDESWYFRNKRVCLKCGRKESAALFTRDYITEEKYNKQKKEKQDRQYKLNKILNR